MFFFVYYKLEVVFVEITWTFVSGVSVVLGSRFWKGRRRFDLEGRTCFFGFLRRVSLGFLAYLGFLL